MMHEIRDQERVRGECTDGVLSGQGSLTGHRCSSGMSGLRAAVLRWRVAPNHRLRTLLRLASKYSVTLSMARRPVSDDSSIGDSLAVGGVHLHPAAAVYPISTNVPRQFGLDVDKRATGIAMVAPRVPAPETLSIKAAADTWLAPSGPISIQTLGQ